MFSYPPRIYFEISQNLCVTQRSEKIGFISEFFLLFLADQSSIRHDAMVAKINYSGESLTEKVLIYNNVTTLCIRRGSSGINVCREVMRTIYASIIAFISLI